LHAQGRSNAGRLAATLGIGGGIRTEPRLNDLLQYLDQNALDFILAEGFKTGGFRDRLYRPVSVTRCCTRMTTRLSRLPPTRLCRENLAALLDLNQPEGRPFCRISGRPGQAKRASHVTTTVTHDGGSWP
jgi:hypothetical protein